MSPWLELLVAVAMVVGIVGLVVPVLPGLVLMWAAVGVWALLDGGGVTRWVTFAFVSVLALVGTIAAIVWSGRKASGAGAPWWALTVAMVGAVVGFFTIPVLGIVVGGVGALWLVELLRLRDPRAAWDTTWAALQGYGIGTLVQLAAGAAILGVWLAGVWVS
ncbi:MAG TPA: DUF456 domain-containing protein [Actinomycetes bacterium]|nr:DUF456 domain-containing protein [Actinomycetes bacterium]